MALDRNACALAIAALGFTAANAFAAGPFGEVHVAANRGDHRGACPITIVYTANVNLHPHKGVVFQYHWERSDGGKGPVHVMRSRGGEDHFTFRDSWRLGGRGMEGDFSETLVLASGNTHERFASPAVHVHCR